jgi:putative transposase
MHRIVVGRRAPRYRRRMARKRRVVPGGLTYELRAFSIDETPLFPDDACRAYFLAHLRKVSARYRLRVRAYCLMRTHYRLLVSTTDANLSAAMRDLNGIYARWFNRRHGRRGHLFGERFDDEMVETDSHLLDRIRDMALGPVRVGLAATPAAWPWSSYASLIGRAPPQAFLVDGAVRRLFASSSRAVAIQRIRAFVETAAWPDTRRQRLAA